MVKCSLTLQSHWRDDPTPPYTVTHTRMRYKRRERGSKTTLIRNDEMARFLIHLLLAALLQLYGASAQPKVAHRTNSWAVEITQGGNEMAERIALQNGFRNLGPVSQTHSNYYIIHLFSASAA